MVKKNKNQVSGVKMVKKNKNQVQKTSSIITPPSGIITPHSNDVLCGRGNVINYHNVHYRYLIQLYKKDYIAAPRTEKSKYSHLIIHTIKRSEPPGRFLKKDTKTNLWCEMDYTSTLSKVKQALREDGPEIKKELQQERMASCMTDESLTRRYSCEVKERNNVEESSEIGSNELNNSMVFDFRKETNFESLPYQDNEARSDTEGSILPLYSEKSNSDFALQIWDDPSKNIKKPSRINSETRKTSFSLDDFCKDEKPKKSTNHIKKPSKLNSSNREGSITLEDLRGEENVLSKESKMPHMESFLSLNAFDVSSMSILSGKESISELFRDKGAKSLTNGSTNTTQMQGHCQKRKRDVHDNISSPVTILRKISESDSDEENMTNSEMNIVRECFPSKLARSISHSLLHNSQDSILSMIPV